MANKTTKRVTIALELSEDFIRLLLANSTLSGWREKVDALEAEPGTVIGLVVLAEARGATVDQVESCIPPEWSGDIKVLSDLRNVDELEFYEGESKCTNPVSWTNCPNCEAGNHPISIGARGIPGCGACGVLFRGPLS